MVQCQHHMSISGYVKKNNPATIRYEQFEKKRLKTPNHGKFYRAPNLPVEHMWELWAGAEKLQDHKKLQDTSFAHLSASWGIIDNRPLIMQSRW